MPRDHRRWEEPPSRRQCHSYASDERRDRHWHSRSAEPRSARSFNFWRDESAVPTSRHALRPYGHGRESHDGRWHAESSYSRRRYDSGPSRHWDDRESRRDWGPPYPGSSCHRHPADATPHHVLRSTFRTRDSVESRPSSMQPVPLDTPRDASPPSEPTSRSPKPYLEYLALSEQPSEVLSEPGLARKLLVLDLNGTLLIRSARSRTSSGPRLRPVQPRPYMQSFRQYLFCPKTKAWLDTMVWSSAQPHSVEDMVDKVFEVSKDELKAIWNRKSLGLSDAEYHQKTAATKDLTKAWSLLSLAIHPEKPKGRFAAPSQTHIVHSALTTLLLDDSPHKAELQPYNHVCIPEYDSKKRQHDLQSLLVTRTKKGKQDRKGKRENRVDTGVYSPGQMALESSPTNALSESMEAESYDDILLAVIGILEVVKLQSNVAGWIRSGGLWATHERMGETSSSDTPHQNVAKAGDATTISDSAIQTGNDASSISDPMATPEQAHSPTKMWFDDSSVVTYWVTRGRRALMELGIQVVHGVMG